MHKQAFFTALLMAIISLVSLQANATPVDDPNYEYKDNQYCGGCHQEKLKEYSQSMMGKTPHDKVFQQFYFATNAKGEFDGFGYKGLHPNEPGDCANCHTPDKVLDAGHEVDLKAAIDGGSKGISCDYCHTVSDVKLIYDEKSGRYDTDITRTVTRARGDTKYGPLGDAKSPVHKTMLSPIHTKSEFCAMCHLNQEHLLSLSTYADWKKSYDAGKVTKQCQECHMPTGGKDRPIALGGKVRPASSIHQHLFHGGHDPAMVKKAATLELHAKHSGNTVTVEADVTNVGAGHTIPGGATLRNIILVVEATDSQGKPLTHTGGRKETLPPLSGKGGKPGDYAGHPGKMFARPFATKTGMVPAGGFNADHILFDTRIWPGDTDHSVYHFKTSDSGPVSIKATLLYRWTYKPLADKKGWKQTDIIMTRKQLTE
ncbi:MAG TPA: hypothetical protein ENJ11_04660 [Gammaproteobacteria bacterium]|nr:hypothetical protein [Gammaproteobacteria bacterium]